MWPQLPYLHSMDFIKRTLPLLLGIFLLSVVVRLPQLNRPLSKHHEFCTAISLRIMQIWYDNGIEKYDYNPVMTYNNPADKYINNSANQTGRMIDKEGNYYYVSHPPFAYYAPYFVFKLLHIRPDVLPLQVFNLLLHFISALFVYFTVCLLSFNRARSLPYLSAVVAYTIYLFLPVTLWFQGNVYMSDMAVHTLFIIGVYIALKMIIRRKFYVPKYIFFYVVVLALMIYTSWLGVFFAAGVIVYSLLHVRGEVKGFGVFLWSTVLVTILMLRAIVYQYSQINGVDAYIEEMLSRYIVRGSLEGTDQGLWSFMFSYLWLIKTLLYNYIIHYIVVYALIAVFVYLAVTRKKLKIVFSENGYRFIWLSAAPVLMLHAVFLNYSVHDFSVLYASLFFSVVLGMLYDKVKKSGAIPLTRMRWGLVAALVLLVVQYQLMNMPDIFKRYEQEDHGLGIKKTVKNDEVVFIANEPSIDPQTVFYAQRNLRYAANKEEALSFLKNTHQEKGILLNLFLRKETGCVEIVERVSVNENE